jgi:rhodanese-related sulfurtransferase
MHADTYNVPELDPRDVYDSAQTGTGVVLDVREPEELQQVAVNEAIHVPLNSLPSRVSEIPRDRNVYVICQVGQRSAMATQFLRELGYDRVWNVRGGIIAWLRARLPVDRSATG